MPPRPDGGAAGEPRPRIPTTWVGVFLTALASIWMIVVFGPEIGDWWSRVSTTLTSADGFRDWVEGLGALGPVAYVLAQALQVILAPIPGSLFPPVGALAFGPWQALVLGMIGLAIGSAVVFLIARRWGRPLAVRFFGEDRIQRYEKVIGARGGALLWLVFLLPLLPDDAVCALAGISGISFRRFMVIATVGRLPAVAVGVFTMAGLEGAPLWVWALATAVAALLLWVGLRYRDAFERSLIRVTHREPLEGDETGSGHEVAVSEGALMVRAESVTDAPDRDPLIPVLAAVLITTSIASVVAVATGVSGLASGLILVWGAGLAVMVASARGED